MAEAKGISGFALVLVGILSCANGGGSDRAAHEGIACGGSQCGEAQVCCLDCDGVGLCVAPGASCPGTACLSRDGGAEHDGGPDLDGDAGLLCGDTVCGSGMPCCIACAGRGTCGSPGFECSGDDCQADAGATAPCTPQGQGVDGTALVVRGVDIYEANCGPRRSALLTSAADLEQSLPPGDAPSALAEVDFDSDRVVLGSSNPALQFAVDDGRQLVVGEESLCQGIAPTCVAYVVHGTTRNTLRVVSCPYTGPDPCLAP